MGNPEGAKLLEANGLDVGNARHWRCVKLVDVDPRGPEMAEFSGSAPVALKGGAVGLGLEIPRLPPEYSKMLAPEVARCTGSTCKVPNTARLVRDLTGKIYWVTVGKRSIDPLMRDEWQ